MKIPPLGYFATTATISLNSKPVDDRQITEAIEAIKKAIKEREPIGEIKIMANDYLPDDMVIVSSNLFKILSRSKL